MVRLPGRSGARSTRRPGGPVPAARTTAPTERTGSGRRAVRRRAEGSRRRTGSGAFTALRSALTGRSVAGQVFVLQVVIVLLLVVAAVVALVLQVRHDSTQEARNRSVAVAETVRQRARAP